MQTKHDSLGSTSSTTKDSMKQLNSTPRIAIAIANKPLRLGGEIKLIPIQEFEQRIGQQFLEQISTDKYSLKESEIPEDITGALSSAQLKLQLEHILKNPRTDLVVCKINDKVGHGVFASSDIPKDTVLCFYSGNLVKGLKKNKETDHAIAFYGLNASISTQGYRGIASFFQHFPSELKHPSVTFLSQLLHSMGQPVSEKDLKLNDELYSIEFKDKSYEKSLAKENTRREFISYNGLPVILIVTNKAILKGDQLGFNYGKDYDLVPELFDTSGSVIPTSAYRRTFYELKLGSSTYIGELAPLIAQLKQGKKQVAFDNENHQQIKVDASIAVDELLRVRGISEDEYQQYSKKLIPDNPNNSVHGLFANPKLTTLISKYNLADTSQTSLEKGMRNAATNNQLDDLKYFIQLVHNINAKDNNPDKLRTALHWAAIKDHKDAYQLLLASGADSTITDAKGNTPAVYLNSVAISNQK